MQSVTTTDKAGYESLLMVYRETDVSQERTRVLSKNTFFLLLFMSNFFSWKRKCLLVLLRSFHFWFGCTGLDVS